MNILRIITALMLVLFISACSQTSVRHHEDFEKVAKNVNSVVIIPADVEIELINFDGENEQLEEKSQFIKSKIYELAKARLISESLEVIDFDFKKEIELDEEFSYAITQAKEAWKAAKEDMYKTATVPEKKKTQFKSSLGSVLNSIAEKTNADSALLIYYSGFEKSKGMIAKDIASSVLVGVLTLGAVVPIQATEGAFIDIALVDTTSGKIIWANRKNAASVDESLALNALKDLPDLTWKSELKAQNINTDSIAISDIETEKLEALD